MINFILNSTAVQDSYRILNGLFFHNDREFIEQLKGSCKFHRHTIAKRVLVYILFASFVRLLACVCKAVNGLSVFKICAKDWFYLQNSHFLVNFAAGYEVRSRTLPHRFCEINSFY